MTILNGKLVTRDINIASFDSSWVKLSVNTDNLKIAFNVIAILEVLFAQVTGLYGLSPEGSMQSSIHKTGMIVLNSSLIKNFITIIVIDETSEYSTKIKDEELKHQFQIILDRSGARNSKYKGIIPDIDMDPDSLMKYRIGFKFHLLGKFQSSPVFSFNLISEFYKISLEKITLKDIKSLSPFPKEFQKSVDFLKGIFEKQNPHYFEYNIDITDIMKDLGIETRSLKVHVNEIEIKESLNKEEKERIKKVNERIKKINKKKSK